MKPDKSGMFCFVHFTGSMPFLLLSSASGSPIHMPSLKASEAGSPYYHQSCSFPNCSLCLWCLRPQHTACSLWASLTHNLCPGQTAQRRGLKKQQWKPAQPSWEGFFPNFVYFWSLLWHFQGISLWKQKFFTLKMKKWKVWSMLNSFAVTRCASSLHMKLVSRLYFLLTGLTY